jgi:hypothetical protein
MGVADWFVRGGKRIQYGPLPRKLCMTRILPHF